MTINLMITNLNKFKEAAEKVFIFKKLLGKYPLANEKTNPISSDSEFQLAKVGYAYYNRNIFNGNLEFLIKNNDKKPFRPKYIDATINAFEVWEVERKDPSSIWGNIEEPEYIFIPIE